LHNDTQQGTMDKQVALHSTELMYRSHKQLAQAQEMDTGNQRGIPRKHRAKLPESCRGHKLCTTTGQMTQHCRQHTVSD
jgi:hypothetical protein